MDKNKDEFLWCEAYRPHKIVDCILPKSHKEYFTNLVKSGEVQNMLLCGPQGSGKTTVARALCEEIGLDHIVVNSSDESGIDILRTKIKQFASTMSFSGKKKVVILDEADYLTPAFQAGLRNFLEEYSSNCRFILTANYKDRLIPAIHSRCAIFEFQIPSEERAELASTFYKRLVHILGEESIKFDKKVLASVVKTYFPDYRRALNELQRYSISNDIDEGILCNLTDESINNLIGHIKDKDWRKMRVWVVNNIDKDPHSIFRALYDNIIPLTDQVPALVLTLADYSYKSAFVADQEINMVACITEIMASVNIK